MTDEIVSANRHLGQQAKNFEKDLRVLEHSAKLAISADVEMR